MSLKENLQKKLKIERLAGKISSTMRETPGSRHLNKDAVRDLLAMTDFEKTRARDLTLYLRPLHGEMKEVVVLDNELPIYHSTVADVAMRKTPHWKEMFSVSNIRKVLNDNDVIVSKGRESLARITDCALALLDLSYAREDLETLLRGARISLHKKLSSGVRESLELFFQLVDFQSISTEVQDPHVLLFARVKETEGESVLFEDLIIFDEKNAEVQLLSGEFSPASDRDLARFLLHVRGAAQTTIEGEGVFEYLVQLALSRQGE